MSEIVRRAMRDLSQPAPAPVPHPKRIWWLAEIRRRQEARVRAVRVMTRTRVAASAAAFGVGCALALWRGSDLPGLTVIAGAAVASAVAVGVRVILAGE